MKETLKNCRELLYRILKFIRISFSGVIGEKLQIFIEFEPEVFFRDAKH